MSRFRTPWSDEEALTVLDLLDNGGLTFAQIAKRVGRSRGSVAGLVKQVRDTYAYWDQDEIQNGTLPRKWWKR